jgi:hypothetical protein
MRKFLFLTLFLLTPVLCAQEPAKALPDLNFTIVEDGLGGQYAVLDGGIVLSMQAIHVPDRDTITSEWMSGGIKRKITTRYTGSGKAGRRLSHIRHNAQVNDALEFWPVDP